MQYHLDGFRPGPPDMRPAAAAWRGADLPGEVDVLIVGCGPAGLCLAAQLAQFPEIRTMIVEQKPGPIEKGQADGVNVRSMEMFQAFGFAETVKRESYWVNQTNFWTPDPADPSRIRRVGRVQDVADDLSEMPHTLLNQARIHELFLDVMRNAPARLAPDYGLALRGLEVPDGDGPVTVTLERCEGPEAGAPLRLQARYVVGCDGARSQVRRAIGGRFQGGAAHQAWGVMDLLANTDFPDVRMKCLIQSAREGNMLILPREGGYLFRIYVELDKLNPDERVANRNLTADHVIAAANRILHPHSLDVKEVVWWSVYEIGHRLSDRFDDLPPNAGTGTGPLPRVFTAGDACHTHSPKAGQGMNVSMGDAFNLGWKLAQVLRGRARPSLLHSYAKERRAEAQRLIDTDQAWSRLMSAPPGESKLDGGDMPRVQQQFIANGEFTAGLAVRYAPSPLVGPDSHQALAAGLILGKRFHSAPVVRLADAMEMQLGHVAEADGRFRLYAFAGAGDSGQPDGAVAALCDWLERDAAAPLRRYGRPGEAPDALIDLRAVFQPPFPQLEITAMPPLLVPAKGRYGLVDLEKVFCVDPRPGRDIYALRGIDRARGCLVVVRPDQYVGHVLPLDARAELAEYFDGLLLAG